MWTLWILLLSDASCYVQPGIGKDTKANVAQNVVLQGCGCTTWLQLFGFTLMVNSSALRLRGWIDYTGEQSKRGGGCPVSPVRALKLMRTQQRVVVFFKCLKA